MTHLILVVAPRLVASPCKIKVKQRVQPKHMYTGVAHCGIDQDALIEVSHFSAHDIREAQCSLIRKRSVASILFRRGVNAAFVAVVSLGKSTLSD